MAVEVISAVERNRDVLERRRIERGISDRAQAARDRTDTLRADAAQQKIADDARVERERTVKLQSDEATDRVQLRNDAERKRLLDLELEREARRVDARKRDELDLLQARDQREAASNLANLEAERARAAGIEAYRAQIERVQLTALTQSLALERLQFETGNNVPAQLAQLLTPQIDQVQLSDLALTRLQAVAGSQLTGVA